MKNIFAVLILLVSGLSFAGERWYADPNLGTAGGIPQDFYSRMNDLSSWNEALSKMDVYYLRRSVVRKVNDQQLKRLADILNQFNITTALDDGAATWAHGRMVKPDFSPSIKTIERLKRLGFKLKYIGLQSVLSKRKSKYPEYKKLSNMQIRFKDVLAYFSQVGKTFPELSIGIIDALPAKLPDKQVRSIYGELAKKIKTKGFKLAFIHIDLPLSYPRKGIRGNSWASISHLALFVKKQLQTHIGIILVSNIGGKQSGKKSWYFIEQGLRHYLNLGLKVDSYIYPKKRSCHLLRPP